MNIQALLASAAIISSSLFLPIEPAQAGTCWYLYDNQSTDGVYCRTVRHINADGHIVYYITDGDGATFSVVLWDDNTATVSGLTTYPMELQTYDDRQGDTRIIWNDGSEFAFSHH